MTNTSIKNAFERMWEHTTDALGNKSDKSHNHDGKYDALGSANTALASAKTYVDGKVSEIPAIDAYTKTEVDTKLSKKADSDYVETQVNELNTNINELNSDFTKYVNISTYTNFNQISSDYNYGNYQYKNTPINSITMIHVANGQKADAYNNGLIPVSTAGTLVINNVGRGFIEYHTDSDMTFYAHTIFTNLTANTDVAWQSYARNSDLTTLTEGTFTPDSSLGIGYSMNSIRVVKNITTGLCEVKGIIQIGSNSITAGATVKMGSVSFRPLLGVNALFPVFTDSNIGKMKTDSTSNIVNLGIADAGGMYLSIPYSKASGTAPEYVPFNLSYYAK